MACPARADAAKLSTMLKIIEAQPSSNPSRAWVEAAWRENPAISPSWWRENLGFTHSKFICDARDAAEVTLPEGVNVVLSGGQDLALPEGIVQLAMVSDATQPCAADVVLWQPPVAADDATCIAAFTVLEQRVRMGELVAYGLDEPLLGHMGQLRPLHAWLALAEQAAEAVWGRKKRPALRVLYTRVDALATAPLLWPSTLLKGQTVPLLEHAVHLGLWVLALPCSRQRGEAPHHALAALAQVAEAEVALHAELQGQWPHVAGQPVFMVLPALQQGHAPWRHPVHAVQWQRSAWPALQNAMQSLEGEAAQIWRENWQVLHPLVPDLANSAAAQALPLLMRARQQHLPKPFWGLGMEAQHLMLCVAMPGVGGVVVAEDVDTRPVLGVADCPDIGGFFG